MGQQSPDVEFIVGDEKTGKVERFLAHRKVVGSVLGPLQEEVVTINPTDARRVAAPPRIGEWSWVRFPG